jgi:hypothetical protein
MNEQLQSSIKFSCEQPGTSESAPAKVEITLDGDATLHQCIETFEGFLLACGYRFPQGTCLDLVDSSDK